MDLSTFWRTLGRHGALVGLVGVALWWLGRWQTEALQTIALGAAVCGAAVLTASLATWAFTRLDLVAAGDTGALSRIFLGVCLLYGLVALGNMAVLVQQ